MQKEDVLNDNDNKATSETVYCLILYDRTVMGKSDSVRSENKSLKE